MAKATVSRSFKMKNVNAPAAVKAGALWLALDPRTFGAHSLHLRSDRAQKP